MFKTTEPLTIFTHPSMKEWFRVYDMAAKDEEGQPTRETASYYTEFDSEKIASDIRRAMDCLARFLDKFYSSKNAEVTPENLWPFVRRASLNKMKARHPARLAQMTKEDINRFKLLVEMDKEEVMSDFRLCILYCLVQKLTVDQRKKTLEEYCKLEQKDMDNPDDVKTIEWGWYLMDDGDGYWTYIAVKAMESYSRMVQMMAKRHKGEAVNETKNDMRAVVSPDGELYHITNKSLAFSKTEQGKQDDEKKYDRKTSMYSRN